MKNTTHPYQTINWKTAEEYIERIFPQIEADLKIALSSISLKHLITRAFTANRPPHIRICLERRGTNDQTCSLNAEGGLSALLSFEQAELTRHQDQIAIAIAGVADQHGLKANLDWNNAKREYDPTTYVLKIEDYNKFTK